MVELAAGMADGWGALDSEARLRVLIESVPLAFVVEDGSGCVRAWNAAAQHMFGWVEADVLGRRFPHIANDGQPEAEARLARVLAGERLLDHEIDCIRSDGSSVAVSLSSARLVDRGGSVFGAISILADLSERKRAERQLTLQMELTRILSECDSVDEAVPRVIAAFCEMQGWACGARWSMDAATGMVRCLETWHAPGDLASASFMAETLQASGALSDAGALLERAWSGEPAVWIEDLGAEAAGSSCAAAVRAGMHAAFAFPVMAGSEIYGVIGLFGRKPAAADPDIVHLGAQFGGQLGNFMARREAERALQFVASHDALTGLPNRVMFSQRLGQALAQAVRYGRQAAVLFVDLDRFKFVNDTMGHDAGDRLLREVAERLRESLREGDTVGRHGGDEFVVLIDQYDSAAQVAGVAKKIIDQVAQAFVFEGQEFHISASIGIATFPNDGRDAQTLMQHADIAMYRAKESGKNQYQFYSPFMNRNSLDRVAIDAALRTALERGEFVLHYQPKVDLEGRRVTSLEALLRWERPGHGLVPPPDFLPYAEETGTAVRIGEWVLRAACTDALRWQQGGAVRVCVNISARHFGQGRLVDCVDAVLRETRLPPQLLELEVTEAMLLLNPDRAVQVLRDLKAMGVVVALDDFGTGYSSLSYLRRFPLDAVKVDRSFVAGIPADPDGVAIARAVISMAHSLRLRAVAEGVETEEQARFLRIQGCDEMQGHFFGAPVPAARVHALLAGEGTQERRKA